MKVFYSWHHTVCLTKKFFTNVTGRRCVCPFWKHSHVADVLPGHVWTEGTRVVNEGEGEPDGQSTADILDVILMDGLTFFSLG